jgi:hypothetical protein
MKTILLLVIILNSSLFSREVNLDFKTVLSQTEKHIFLDSLNKYRLEKGLKKVEYSNDAEKLANNRIYTIYKHRKDILNSITKDEYRKNFLYHLHFGLYEDIEGFNINLRDNPKNNYIMINPSENVAIFFENNGKLLYKLFDGWKHSPSHWEAMMDESNDTVSLEIKETDQGTIACLILFKKFNKKR